MEPGRYKISSEEYHAAPGISKSTLDRLHPTPAHFNSIREDDTDATVFGRCLHSALLENKRDFVVQPATYQHEDGTTRKWNGNAGPCKAWYNECNGRDVLNQDEADTINAMADKIHAHPWVGKVLRGANTEESIFVKCPKSGLLLKCRPDIQPAPGRIRGTNPLVDIKTCRNASKAKFSKEMANLGYHRQAYFYLKVCNLAGLKYDSFIFVCIEKEHPYEIAVWDLDDDSIKQGGKEIERDLFIYQHCMNTGVWDGYPKEPQMISIPEYSFDKQLE